MTPKEKIASALALKTAYEEAVKKFAESYDMTVADVNRKLYGGSGELCSHRLANGAGILLIDPITRNCSIGRFPKLGLE
jgi:hypothetical protein